MPGHGPDPKKKTDVFLPSEIDVLSGTLGVGQKTGPSSRYSLNPDRGLPHFFREIPAPDRDSRVLGQAARGVSPGGSGFGLAGPVFSGNRSQGHFFRVWGWSGGGLGVALGRPPKSLAAVLFGANIGVRGRSLGVALGVSRGGPGEVLGRPWGLGWSWGGLGWSWGGPGIIHDCAPFAWIWSSNCPIWVGRSSRMVGRSSRVRGSRNTKSLASTYLVSAG